ncbi:MAG TPA: NADH-quinone oxidoreductase subunit N [Gemmatimonadaceae bacterium]|jgi:NADH-quinone oxidoreductase subunit N|nr:NADH-quinone oxidoreductase subunit N [Gemmatimonadaceae bacterium]
MNFDLSVPTQLMQALTPDLVLMVGAMVLMLVAAWRPDSNEHQRLVGYCSIGVLLATLAVTLWFGNSGLSSGPGVIAVDGYRFAADSLFLLAALGAVALGIEYNGREGIFSAESHVLVLFATSGMMIMAAARDLMIVFLGIEMMSIAVYVLAGMNRRSRRSAEGSLKYFLLGAFSTGFLLYGIALVYGATGSTNLTTIGANIVQFKLAHQSMLLMGIGLLLVGFGFKVAAVPFHMWAPDVYEGAPTPITAYMAAAVKAAAFAVFLRVWRESFDLLDFAWLIPLWWIAAATMVYGNVVALAQRNVKRLLAYSSIVHSGYLLVAIAAGTNSGSAAFLFYLLAYTLATYGAFAVVCAMSRSGERDLEITDYEGLWSVRPVMAVGMAVCMLALLGFPIFGGAGFWSKVYVLAAAEATPFRSLVPLAILLVLASVISAGYYLQIVRVMFMKPRPDGAQVPPPMGTLTRIVLAVSVALVLLAGIAPARVVNWARDNQPAPPKAATAVSTAKAP